VSEDEGTQNLKLNKSSDFLTHYCIIRSFKICIPYQIFYGNQIKENEIGGHVTLTGDKKRLQHFRGKT
jgi:hypothetical protein